MTRWARGDNANKKKPLEATPWEEMQQKPKKKKKDKNVNKTKEPVKTKSSKKPNSSGRDSEFKVKNEWQDVKKSKKLKREKHYEKRLTELLGSSKDAAGLQDEEKDSLVEFLHKEDRREKRRVKRIQQRQNDKVCFTCREQGHDVSECPKTKGDLNFGTGICFKCGSTEHTVHQCRARVPAGEYPFAKCFICGEKGHLSKQCPDNPRGLYPKGGCCKLCGSVEHFKKDCPENQQKQGIFDYHLATIDSTKSVDEDDSLFFKAPVKKTVDKGPKIVKF